MRNLKRVLSLALAVVMVIGMMVMTTGAADFVDADKIDYAEAVDVMAALEVLEGYEGSFNPDAILTREQAAKIICYMLMGKANAEKLPGSSNYADVEADRWSAPFIAYCDSLGIVSGYNGNFDPTGELTGVAFAKMLLVALGYDAKTEGYVNNDNWSTNIGSDAIEAGLSIPGVSLDAAVSRESAAQMAFQALTATMVEYEGGMSITTPDGTSINAGAVRYNKGEGTTYETYKVNGVTPVATDNLQFCEKHFPGLKCAVTPAGVNEIGNTTWTVDGQPVSVVYNAPAYVFTTSQEKPAALGGGATDGFKKAVKAVTSTTNAANLNNTVATTSISVDGAAGAAAVDTVAKLAALTGDGVKVEVYTYVDTGVKKIAKIVVTNEVLVQIINITENSKGVKTFTLDEASQTGYTVNAPVYSAAEDADNSIYDALCEFKKFDYVLLTVTKGTTNYDIVTVAAPETASGTVTKLNPGKTVVTLDGKDYTGGANYDVDGTDTALGNDCTVYMDSYGNALYCDKTPGTSGAPATTPNVIFVATTWTEGSGKNQANWFEGVTVDGEVITAKFANIGDGDYTNAKGWTGTDANIPAVAATAGAVSKAVEYAYDEANATYVFKEIANSTANIGVWGDFDADGKIDDEPTAWAGVMTALVGTADETAAVSSTDLKLGSLYYADTVKFVFVETKTDAASKVKVVEGVPTLDTLSTGTGVEGLVETKDFAVVSKAGDLCVVTTVFVTASEPKAADPEKQDGIIFVPEAINTYKSSVLGADGKTAIYSIEAYVDGVKQELWLKTNPATTNVTAGFKTSTVDATTGALNLDNYVAPANTAVLGEEAITEITTVNGKTYVTTSTLTGGKFDATNAVVVDVTTNNIGSLAQAKALMEEYDISIQGLYTSNAGQSKYTVEYIYITDVAES